MENKIIELDNNEKYIVADTITHKNQTFLILGKIKKEDEIDDLVFAELIGNKVKKINDENTINQLKEIYKLNLN